MNKRKAALAALLMVGISASALEAAPAKRSSSAAAKKKAAANAAARTAAAREAARIAAEAARVRAQWGLLADVAEGDFDAKGTLVTFRKENAETVAITVWAMLGKQTYRVIRDPASGALTYDYSGGFDRDQSKARIGAGGTVEVVTKNDVSWPLLKRDETGALILAYAMSKRLTLTAVDPASKTGQKLAKLIAEGKVSPVNRGGPVRASGAATGVATVTAPTAVAPIQSMAAIQANEGVDFFRNLSGDWSNEQRLWTFASAASGVAFDQWGVDGKQIWNGGVERKGERLLFGGTPAIPIAGGMYFKANEYAILMKSPNEFIVTAGKLKDGNFVPKSGQNMPFLGTYRRLSTAQASDFRARAQANLQAAQLAERQRKQSKGSNGMLGGLMAGFGAAMAGGNAEMIMGAAMKGVEMTTDNQMSRNVLAGKGDAMISDGVATMRAKNAPAGRQVASAGKAAAAPSAAKPAAGSTTTTAFVACHFYAQHAGRKWEFFVSQVGEMESGTGEAWPDSPSDAVSQTWSNYLTQRGADVAGVAATDYPDYPTCHGSKTRADAELYRAGWLRDVRKSSVPYIVHEESWAPQ